MKRFALVFFLIVVPISGAVAEEWKPFLPRNINRSYNAAMDELAVKADTRIGRAFWREMEELTGYPPDQLRDALERDLSVVACEGTETLLIARVNARGEVAYYRRRCFSGERIVYFGDEPLFSTRCGNPVREVYDPSFQQDCGALFVAPPAYRSVRWGETGYGYAITPFTLPPGTWLTFSDAFGGGVPVTSMENRALCVSGNR